ncbi:MAG: hypothetical protein KF729_32355 [Sandaracinaceae bacterium]|nr:hypothetical protein [Sandaracinaceae bacterium]
MIYTVAELAETFQRLLGELGRILDEQGVDWMIVGGLAVGAWTEPRGTKDCDLAIAVPADTGAFERALERAGLRVARGDLTHAARGGSVRLQYARDAEPPLAIDLLCAGTEFEREALARRRRIEVLGVRSYVVAPDDLVVYKLIAGRPQDVADVDRLLRFGRAPEDEARLRYWAREWEVEERLDRALATAKRGSDG